MPTRKMRKSRKGGTEKKKAITTEILFTVSGMPEGTVRQFIPLFSMKGDRFKNLLIESVNAFKEVEPEDDTVLEEDIRIHRIRGAADVVLFEGNIAQWTVAQIITFLYGLQVGDVVHVEIIQN